MSSPLFITFIVEVNESCVALSIQMTSVLFRSPVALLMLNIEVSGAEILKVNITELTTRVSGLWPKVSINLPYESTSTVPFAGIILILHSKRRPVVIQLN